MQLMCKFKAEQCCYRNKFHFVGKVCVLISILQWRKIGEK